MSLWAFRFLLFYIVVLFVAPQVRFAILHTIHLADICIISAVVLHIMSSARENRSFIRFGPATVLAIILMTMGMLSLHMGPLQSSSAWNGYIDGLMKSALVVILVEAMAYSIQRVWAVIGTIMISTLWWLKAGFRLGLMGATFEGGRIMGPAVNLVSNPNGFAFYLCVVLPVYLYFYSQAKHKVLKWGYIVMVLIGVYSIFNSGSRTGLLTLLVATVLVFPRYGRRHFIAFSASIVGTILILGAVDPANLERFKTIGPSFRTFIGGGSDIDMSQMTPDEYSAFLRSMKNKDGWRLVKDYPAFGVGISADTSLYERDYPYATGVIHNEILMAGRQMGFAGMGIYLAFQAMILFSGLVVMFRMRKIWPDISSLGWVLSVMAVIFIVGGYFATDPWNPFLLVVAAAGSSLLMLTRDYRSNARVASVVHA